MKTKSIHWALFFLICVALLGMPGAVGAAGHRQEVTYDDMIANADTQRGVLTIHRWGDSWLLEIPPEMLGRPFYWYSELSQVPAEMVSLLGLGSIGEKVVTFDWVGRDILVWAQDSVSAKRNPGDDVSLDRAVAESALPAVLLSLEIMALSPDGAPVVNLGEALSKDLDDFSVAQVYQSLHNQAYFQSDRSRIIGMDAYPDNIGVSSLLTFQVMPQPSDDYFGGFSAAPSSQSVLVRHNFMLLPETPMAARYADRRVGYFAVSYQDYSGAEDPDVVNRRLITRFRLEKQDPAARLSEPVQPIVFYISREVPARWRPYIRQGVEDWQPAFEAAGFANAIVAEDAPGVDEDPNWNPADLRYSLIRWVAQPIAYARGPIIVDPRSGEILSAHVQIFADMLEALEQMYFAQASAVDPRARELPLPEEVLGPLLRYVTAHEIGHALGLSHNHKASQAFTIDQLRSPRFTDRYGTAPSIMSYGRFNYIAQPGDGVTNLIPQVGPYDRFAIQWGYAPVAGAESPEDERATLDRWAARQISQPWLRFGGEDFPSEVDPTVLMENLGDDRIAATRLGIANLERAMGYLVPATTRLGGDYDKLGQTYDTILAHRMQWLASVIKLIGGVEETRTLAGRGEAQFHRVPKEQQQEAVQFVLENLHTPTSFIPTTVLDRLTPADGLYSIRFFQQHLLRELLDMGRLARMAEVEQLDSAGVYQPIEYLGDLRVGLFDELQRDALVIEPLRRDLQRFFVDTLLAYAGDDHAGDLRSAARWNLSQLLPELQDAEARSGNATATAHLADLSHKIAAELESPDEPVEHEFGP